MLHIFSGVSTFKILLFTGQFGSTMFEDAENSTYQLQADRIQFVCYDIKGLAIYHA